MEIPLTEFQVKRLIQEIARAYIDSGSLKSYYKIKRARSNPRLRVVCSMLGFTDVLEMLRWADIMVVI